MIKETLKKIRDIQGYPCITLLLQTHRTRPANQQDAIQLKNLIKEVEERLAKEFDNREIAIYSEKLHQISEAIDHNHNLDGLAIFVNQDEAEYVRLPIAVESRAVIDQTFATRDLVRAMSVKQSYFILTLNQQESRLYEALGNEIVREIKESEFPYTQTMDVISKEKAAQGLDDNLLREYFNQVDKAFQEVHKRYPGEVVLVGSDRNIGYFHEVTDDARCIMATIDQNVVNGDSQKLVEQAWGKVSEVMSKRKEKALDELGTANGRNLLVSGLGEIWELVQQGRGELLVVEEGYFQPVEIKEDKIEMVSDAKAPGIVDDIVDEIVEEQLRYKGRVVFLPDGSLEDYERIALTLRY